MGVIVRNVGLFGTEVTEMMYGYGSGWGWWMMLMPLLWITLVGLVVWAAVRLTQRPGQEEQRPQVVETPQEILDRRFAQGEIDADAYEQARATLAGRAGTPTRSRSD